MNTEQMKPHQPRSRLIDTPGCRVGCDSAGSAPVIDHVCLGGRGGWAEHDRLLLGRASLPTGGDSLQEPLVRLAGCLNIKNELFRKV